MDRRYLIEVAATLLGTATVVVGGYVPSLRTNPDLPPGSEVPDILIPGMNAGLDVYDLPILLAVVVVLAAHLRDRSATVRGTLAVLTGFLAILIATKGTLDGSLAGFGETFVPATGWYLTTAGGGLLVVAGGVALSKPVLELVERVR